MNVQQRLLVNGEQPVGQLVQLHPFGFSRSYDFQRVEGNDLCSQLRHVMELLQARLFPSDIDREKGAGWMSVEEEEEEKDEE